MYNFVSSPNHIFVSCQHTTINFSKRYWFLGSFSSGFDKFSPTGLFQKLTKPFKGGWPCIDGFGYCFRVPWSCMKQWSVWWRFCALQKWQKRFVCSTKIFYFKCHRSRYFEYIKNFSCETMCLFEQRFWLAVLLRTTEETAITSFSYDHEIRETSKKLDWFTEGIFTWSYITRTRICTLNIWRWWWGGGQVCPPLPPCKCL